MPNLSADAVSARFHAVQGMARALGQTALSYFGDATKLETSMKGFQDWLTIADGTVEKEFRTMIAEAFPGDAVMGEEMGGGAASALWIIDPIDGTANFSRGDRQWCISIGLVLDGVPTLGLLHSAALDEMWLGRKGHGSTLNGKPIRVADTRDVRRASIEAGWSPRRPTEVYIGAVERLFAQGASVKRGASGALGLAHVANGRTDAYFESHINAWDVAAGLVIAAEAGAVINPFCTGNWLENGNPILCATPGIAEIVAREAGIPLAVP
jgi:myo-inositol-1(or 4)-monophosphatase